MKLLIVATPENKNLLEGHLADDFALEWCEDAERALERIGRENFDVVVLHVDVGEDQALDVISQCRRLPPERMPGLIAVAKEPDLRVVVELVRTGAYDVVTEASLKPRELPHSVRNAAYFAKSAAWLAKRRAQAAGDVWVVGGGDAGESVAMLLDSSGVAVKRFTAPDQALEEHSSARAIVVDLASMGDGRTLVKLLRAH